MASSLVSDDEVARYELELSGLSAAELRSLQARYDSDDDPESSDAERGMNLAGKTAMEAAMIRGALGKVKRDAKARAKRVEEARLFRLQVYCGAAKPPLPRHGEAYWATHDRLLALGQRMPATLRAHTVTDFRRWVHSLYGGRGGTPAAMREGKFVERSIAKFVRPLSHPDWELVCSDPLIEGKRPDAKPISALSIGGKPMWGAPDLVFRHLPTGELVIVERKASDKLIPVDGWPDLRAQLWCYAQIDDPVWKEAPAIRLVGEVWRVRSDGKLYLRVNEGGLMRWTKGDETFDATNASLFALYKAQVERGMPQRT